MCELRCGVRGARERAVQTISYETGGIILASPFYSVMFESPMTESIVLMAAISGACMVWAAFFNIVYDRIEFAVVRRVASNRPHHWRCVHAVSIEATSFVVTAPIVMILTGCSFLDATIVDISLTLFYSVYAYLFYLMFDRLRPVRHQGPYAAIKEPGK